LEHDCYKSIRHYSYSNIFQMYNNGNGPRGVYRSKAIFLPQGFLFSVILIPPTYFHLIITGQSAIVVAHSWA